MAAKKIDINTATVSDLENLAGVGHHRAEAIVKHRMVSVKLKKETFFLMNLLSDRERT